ncbi:predicted protein [Histoplasma capsulatum G186AR]|uniref:Uncharacterized protein n=1 Tax=Ajellomyces capsulatus (strain G186AR / H82 / ATCC MYA-2454 / RMSCC 2432) TaxID=447093 RepID=C0NSQ2_AJECG|nr:uncharacterized protein HCBG_06182 [Histoplasma capsulatum G186AR]EEH05918.1 predicted protein [Histoplasma capsulatum G186AR]
MSPQGCINRLFEATHESIAPTELVEISQASLSGAESAEIRNDPWRIRGSLGDILGISCSNLAKLPHRHPALLLFDQVLTKEYRTDDGERWKVNTCCQKEHTSSPPTTYIGEQSFHSSLNGRVSGRAVLVPYAVQITWTIAILKAGDSPSRDCPVTLAQRLTPDAKLPASSGLG